MTNKEAEILAIKLMDHSSKQWQCLGDEESIIRKIHALRYCHDDVWRIIRLFETNYQWAYNILFKSLCRPEIPFNLNTDLYN